MSSVEPDDAASSPTARDVVAFNLAAASENKIHDDAVARRLGYHGGLVPGVAVYAYMAHMPVKRWGRAWLENGIAECRLRKPVYDQVARRWGELGFDGAAPNLSDFHVD